MDVKGTIILQLTSANWTHTMNVRSACPKIELSESISKTIHSLLNFLHEGQRLSGGAGSSSDGGWAGAVTSMVRLRVWPGVKKKPAIVAYTSY